MKKSKDKKTDKKSEDTEEEMREIVDEDDTNTIYSDSGHASDAGSIHSDDVESGAGDDTRSEVSIYDDKKERMKKMATERLRKCLLFMNEFWKVLLFLLQTGVLGGMGLLAYYMEFLDLFPKKHTVFNCNDESISQHLDPTVFEHFAFGNNIAEQWLYLFSWMAPPGIIILTELCYSMHTGCRLSHHLKTPLILRRTFRIIGNYFFGVIACLLVAKSMKLFLATPRPYFLSLCQPNVTDCFEATEAICTLNNHTVLDDIRTSFPSMPVAALSYGCIFIGAYLHQMVKNAKAFVLQPLAATLFLIIALLGSCIEVGIKRSHWYDVAVGFLLGALQAAYQVMTLNCFVEKFQPPLPPQKEDTWMQTDPIPEPESDDEYPYEEIRMGQLPKRKKRYIDDSTCFHRATSFDSSFQSDMARSVKIFKDMNSIWDASAPPSLEKKVDQGYFEQTLPEIKEEPESEHKHHANEEKAAPDSSKDNEATPAEKHVDAEAIIDNTATNNNLQSKALGVRKASTVSLSLSEKQATVSHTQAAESVLKVEIEEENT